MNKKQYKRMGRKQRLPEQSANFFGNPSFGGTGNYGYGGNRQLAAPHKDIATQDIAEKEQDEINQNVDDQEWRLGKFSLGGHTLLGPSDTKPTEETLGEQAPYDNSTNRMRDLPGFPRMNTLVNPKQHTPQDEEDVEYMGPTLDGKPIMDNKKEKRANKEEDEIEKLLQDTGEELSDEEEIELFLQNLEETLNNAGSTFTNRRGWNNIQINSLCKRKNHLDPEGKEDLPDTWRPMFREPRMGHNPPAGSDIEPASSSPIGSMGVVGWPKKFVPPDYGYNTISSDENSDIESGDPLGSKRLQNPPSAPMVAEALLKELIREIFKSKAQQKYFWWKANKGGKEGKKWKKMAKEFQKSTPKDVKLPDKVEEIMTPMGDTSLKGTRSFIQSRKKILNKEDE